MNDEDQNIGSVSTPISETVSQGISSPPADDAVNTLPVQTVSFTDDPYRPRKNKRILPILLISIFLLLTLGTIGFVVSQPQIVNEIRSRAAEKTCSSNGGSGQTGQQICAAKGADCDDDAWGWHTIQCMKDGCPIGQGRKTRCNWGDPDGYSCVERGSDEYSNQCRDIDGEQHWQTSDCITDASCNIDTSKESNVLTFETGKTLVLFLTNMLGPKTYTVTLTNTVNPSDVVTLNSGQINTNETKTFSPVMTVGTNNKYTIKVQISGDPGESYGWNKVNADNTCHRNNNEVKDVSSFITNAQNQSSPTYQFQCWADALVSDWTQDYDFNDFFLAFGYGSVYRQDVCDNASTTKTSMQQGDQVTISSKSLVDANEFWYAFYNLDNLKAPNDPKPICVSSGGGDTRYTSACPAGTYALVYYDPSTQTRKTGSITLDYDDIFVKDANWGNKQVLRTQVLAYFALKDVWWSYPNAKCIVKINQAAPTSTPTSKPPTSTPTKKATPTPTSKLTPTPTKKATPTPTSKLTPTPTKKATPTPTKGIVTPTPVQFMCKLINIYHNGAIVDPEDLTPGSKIVIGVAHQGAEKARIKINNGDYMYSEELNDEEEFIFQYTLPLNVTDYTINADVYRDGVWK